MKTGAVPYDYAYLEGRPANEPKECKIVLQIQSLWQTGKGCAAIDVRQIKSFLYLQNEYLVSEFQKV